MSRTTKLLTVSTAVLAPWLLMSTALAQDSDSFAPVAAITLSFHHPIRSFDISFVDPGIGLYILGDRTLNAIDMVDTHQNLFLGFCGQGQFQGAKSSNDISGPDGVLIVGSREIWAGDGDSTVKVFDIAGCGPTTTPKKTIATGTVHDKRADEMCFDPINQLVMVANNAADPPFASIISATSYSVVAKIPFDGTNKGIAVKSTNGIEQCQWSPVTRKFYITVPGVKDPDDGTGVVVQIDPTTATVTKVFPIDRTLCDTPQGMAVGPDNQILIGCNGNRSTNKSSVVIDGNTGCGPAGLTCVHVFADESGPDEVWFNPGNNHYYLARSNADGGVQMIGSVDAFIPPGSTDTSITVGPAGRNAHSVAADAVTNKVFVPIPASPHFTLCGSVGGHNSLGCILVLTGTNDGDDNNNCFAAGSPTLVVIAGGTPLELRTTCTQPTPIPPQ